jgi:hypothetical protein
MNDEEAANWVIAMGPTNEARIQKIEELLRNCVRDNMSPGDKVFLEQVLKVLRFAPQGTNNSSKHPCPQCGIKRSDTAGSLCYGCKEIAVDQADSMFD